jgi:hypothetical protein
MSRKCKEFLFSSFTLNLDQRSICSSFDMKGPFFKDQIKHNCLTDKNVCSLTQSTQEPVILYFSGNLYEISDISANLAEDKQVSY